MTVEYSQLDDGYICDLYLDCDFPDDSDDHHGRRGFGPSFDSFTGETPANARNDARKGGWKFERGMQRVLCPYCIKQGRRLPE